MSPKLTMILASAAGFFLAIAGVAFFFWQPPGNAAGSVEAMAAHLSDHQGTNVLYVVSVFLSIVLILPVVLILSIRLYARRPTAAVVAGSLFVFGNVLEALATLASLSQWAFAVPEAAKGDNLGIRLYQTLTFQYLAVDFSGVGLLYVAAVIYAVTLWRVHRSSSWFLIISIGLLIMGFVAVPIASSISPLLTSGSIIVYGMAYVALGRTAVKL
jgi:Ca2+/Na+ antiporter